MRLSKVMLVFRKDWLEVRRNLEIMAPIILVPLILTIAIPAAVILVPGSLGGSTTGDLGPLFANLPEFIRAELSSMSEAQAIIYVALVYMFAPFFLLIPAMASSVIASDSFAGEKERKTLEALLATPLSDAELMTGKMIVAFVPSMAVTLLSWAAYTIISDALTYSLFMRPILPTLNWVLVVLGLAPAIALTGIGLTVIISARVKGYREAQQLSVLLIIPILGLIVGQLLGVLLLDPTTILVLIFVIAIIDYIIIRLGLRIFGREEILSRSR